MIKDLLLCSAALVSLGTPSIQNNSILLNDVVENIEYKDGMKITYLYSTNEVETLEDLVIGNIYHLELSSYSISSNQFLYINNYYNIDLGFWSSYTAGSNYDIPLLAFTSSGYTYLYDHYDSHSSGYRTNSTTSIDFVYRGSDNFTLLELISKCENIPVKSVERYYPNSIMGNISQFIDDYILQGIPLIDEVTHSINGVNVTLKSWLNTSICIVLAILLISLLVFFVRWIFRLFASLLH